MLFVLLGCLRVKIGQLKKKITKHNLPSLQTSRSSKVEPASQHGKTHRAVCKIHDMVKSLFSLSYIHINTTSVSHTHRPTCYSCQDNGTDADKVG